MSDAKYVHDDSDRRVVAGDVLFNNTNSPALVGKTAHVTVQTPMAYSNHMTRLRPSGGILPKFLSYQLHWLWKSGYFRSVMSHHVNQASVSTKVLVRTRIVIPPQAEQRRIVTALEDHFSRLDAAAQTVGLVGRRAARLNLAYLEELLGELKDQPIRTLGNLLREPLRNGYSGRASRDGSGVRTLTLTAVTKAEFSDRNTKMAITSGRNIDDLWLEPGDILVERSNTPELVGTAALYNGPRRWAIFPDLLIRVRPNGQLMSEYLHLVLSSHRVHQELRRSAKGLAGTMPKIDQGALERIQLPVPDLRVQAQIVARAKEVDVAVRRMCADIDVAQNRNRQLRHSLFAEAFAGRLVQQELADEPASALLERIQAARAAQVKPKRARRKKNDTGQGELL